MGVEGTLEIPTNDTFKSDKLRSDSPIVLPSVSVMTNLVDELPDDEPADCPEVLCPDGVWKITVVWPWVSEALGTRVEEATAAGPGVGGGGICVMVHSCCCCCGCWKKLLLLLLLQLL